MLRKLYLVPVLALFLLPAIAKAQFEEGNWTLQLAGQGSNDKDFESGQVAVQFDLGYFLTKEINVGVREALDWNDGGSSWGTFTTLYVDYHFDMDRWQPFVGAFIGYAYGDGVDDDGNYGPEGGVKYFVNSTTFIAATVQYVLPFDSDNDEFWQYSVAVGWKW